MARPSKREEIAQAALRQFREYGFNATGVSDITAAAGAPKGSFYNHFTSKEECALEALSRYGDGLRFDILTTPGVPHWSDCGPISSSLPRTRSAAASPGDAWWATSGLRWPITARRSVPPCGPASTSGPS